MPGQRLPTRSEHLRDFPTTEEDSAPLKPQQSNMNKLLRQAAIVLCLGIIYLAVSVSMITMNKFLLDKKRFPFPVHLVLIHMGATGLLMAILFLIKPSVFTSLTDPDKRDMITARLVLRSMLPLVVLFAFEMILGNAAYAFSSVAFLQMMKQSIVVWVYFLSIPAALETFSTPKLSILVFILAATMVSVHGDTHFDTTGFILQALSIMSASTKTVIQGVVLTGKGLKLDVLSYVLLVAPLCFLLLSVICGAAWALPQNRILSTPAWQDISAWGPHIAVSTFLAFSLNVTVAAFMSQTSAVSFVLAGITKDVVIVSASSILFSEPITTMQGFGFAFQLVGIWTWSMMKTFPSYFEDGLSAACAKALCNKPGAAPDESNYGTCAAKA